MLKSWSRPLFFVLIAGSLTIWWRPLVVSFTLALADERYTHILLILPISATLIFLDWKTDSKPSDTASLNSAAIACATLIAILSADVFVRWKELISGDIQLAVNMLALVVWWIAAFVLCFGTRAVRRALFPLCFLLWMVPPPEFVMDVAVGFFQRGSAVAAHLLFIAARIQVAQRGMLIRIPGLIMEVAPECSSIRSSLMLLVTTMVLAHLLLRSGWKKLLVVLAAIPLSIVKNGLRIFVLGILATRVDPSFLIGRLHREGGIIYFLIALAAILVLLWVLRRSEAERREPLDASCEARMVKS